MATITSANMEFVLDEVVSSVMFESFFDEPYMYPMLFDVRTSNKRRERSASIGGLGEYTEKAVHKRRRKIRSPSNLRKTSCTSHTQSRSRLNVN